MARPQEHAPALMKFRLGQLRRHAGPDARGQCVDHPQAAAAHQGRAGHGRRCSPREDGAGAVDAAAGTSEHDQGAAGAGHEYDAVSRLRDNQLGDERGKDIHNFIVRACCAGFHDRAASGAADRQQIDKADIEFPNDLLRSELDRMSSTSETRELVRRAPAAGVHHVEQRENCPTRSCAAASSHTSSSPTRRPCRRSSTCTPAPEEELLGAALKNFYDVQPARAEEETVDLRTAGRPKPSSPRTSRSRRCRQGRQGIRAAARRRC